MSISQIIDEAAKRGGLTAITLWPTQDGWQANVKRRINGQEGWCCMAGKTPSTALLDALQGAVSAAVVQDRPRLAKPAVADKDEDIFG